MSATAAGTGAIVGAKMQSGAAKDAAQLQTDAANHAADVQKQEADATLAFQKQQAENDWLNAQATQRANYEQSKARYGSIAGVASQYGLNLAGMPDFTPGIDPHFDTGATALPSTPTAPNSASTPPGSTSAALPNIDPSKGDIGQQVSAYFKSRGVSDSETPYWVQKWAEFGAKDPAYFNSRLAAADIFSGGPSAPSGSVNAATKAMPSALTAGLQAPTALGTIVTTPIPTPYQPGSIAALRRTF